MTTIALLWTLLACVAASAHAEVVADLHAATVPVANQSSDALTAAAREALAVVLVKVSGSEDLLRNPAIVAALNDARNNVQQYAYVRGEPPAAPLLLHFEFDGAFVTNLVRRSGAPLWTANRPTVLAWVVVEDEQGRHFVNRDSAPLQAQMLVEAFSRRGVPVQLPVFDLVDTAAVSTEDAWRLDASVLQAASARYHPQDIVAARVAGPGEGALVGDWSFLHKEEQVNRAVSAPDLQAFFREGVNVVAAEMAARYAISPTTGGAGGVRISISGVSTYAEYAAIVSWLEGLELVDNANIVQVQGDRIDVRLQAQADASQLAATIELNDRLLPIPLPMPVSGAQTSPESSAQLNYQWRK
jgi:hypothetical protein